MTARRLAYLLILQTLLLVIGGGVLLRHALQDDLGVVQSPVVFVLTHDTHLATNKGEQTPLARLYTLV